MAKLLIVEDDESQRLFFQEELEGDGYGAVLAENGKNALEYLGNSLCDLIVLDIRMQEMKNTEVLRKIVDRYRRIPVIIHTAYPEYRNEFVESKAYAFAAQCPADGDHSMLLSLLS